MGNIVADGDTFMCPLCTGTIKLAVSSSSAQGDSKNLANTGNYSLSAPGAQCLVVPTAPSPCQPSVSIIDPGQTPVTIDGKAALGSGCTFMCAKGGLLTVASSGQSSAVHNGAKGAAATVAADLAAARKNEKKRKKTDEKVQKIRDEKGKLLPGVKPKSIGLPSYKTIRVDMDHIKSGHMVGGTRASQSGKKGLFPPHFTPQQVQRAVVEAYRTGKIIGRQGERVKMNGVSRENMKIELYTNTKTKTIETAYPRWE